MYTIREIKRKENTNIKLEIPRSHPHLCARATHAPQKFLYATAIGSSTYPFPRPRIPWLGIPSERPREEMGRAADPVIAAHTYSSFSSTFYYYNMRQCEIVYSLCICPEYCTRSIPLNIFLLYTLTYRCSNLFPEYHARLDSMNFLACSYALSLSVFDLEGYNLRVISRACL